MNESTTKLLTIIMVFIIGMVSASAVILTSDEDDGEKKTEYITPEPRNQTPIASMFASSTEAYPYQELTFDASASVDPDGTIVSYNFDFGDGEETGWQVENTVIHSYRNVGEYTASLSVRDSNDTVNGNPMKILITVEELEPDDVIVTSDRSMESYDEAFETIDSSPLSMEPMEGNPVDETDVELDPDVEITNLPYNDSSDDPEYPDMDSMQIEEPDIDLDFEDLKNANAGYDSAEDWEETETEFMQALDDIPEAGSGDLEDDHVAAFAEDFGTFERNKDTDDSSKHFNYRVITIVNVTAHDSDEDGNPEHSHIEAMSYEALGKQENPTYESLYSSDMRTWDNDSDGNQNYLRIKQFGYESVDRDGDGNPEYAFISIRVILMFDNNSDGNPDYVHAFEVAFVRLDKNDDGHAGFQAAHFKKFQLWDENSDGNFKTLVFFEWNTIAVDRNNNTHNEYAALSGKSLVMHDNSSDGNPDYAQYKHFGIASRDRNDDGTNEVWIAAFEGWLVRDDLEGESDGKPEVIDGSKAYVRHHAVVNSTIFAFERLVLFDNSSDGVHNHMHYNKGAWVAKDTNRDGNREFEAIKFTDFVIYKNDTTKEGPSYIRLVRFTGAHWDEDSDGEPEVKYYDAEMYVKEDEDQDGVAENEWHVEYQGNGEEE